MYGDILDEAGLQMPIGRALSAIRDPDEVTRSSSARPKPPLRQRPRHEKLPAG